MQDVSAPLRPAKHSQHVQQAQRKNNSQLDFFIDIVQVDK